MHAARWLRRPIVWLPVSIGLLVLLIWRSRLWEAGAQLGRPDVAPVASAVGLSIVVALLWAIRSADLLAAAGRPVGILPLVPMTAFANTINNLTPGSAGEVVRMYLLRAHHDVGYATSGAVVFIERVGAIGLLGATALLAWSTWAGLLPPAVALALAAIVVVAPGLAIRLGVRPLALVAGLPAGRLVGADRWGRFGAWLRRVDATVAGLIGSARHLAAFVVLSVAIFATYAAQLLLVGRAVGVELDPLAAWGALGLATIVGVLSLLPFGLGTTDLTLVALLGAAGVGPLQATAMTFGYRLVSTLPLSMTGIASFAFLSARLPERRAGDLARLVRGELADGIPEPIAER